MGCYQGKAKDIIQPHAVAGASRNVLPQVSKEFKTLEKIANTKTTIDNTRKSDTYLSAPKEYWVYNPNIEKKLRVPQLSSADNCGIWKRREGRGRCTSIEASIPKDQTQ